MDQRVAPDAETENFINRWQGLTASELATEQSFVIELCDLLAVDKPHPTPDQSYMFERPRKEAHGDGSQSDRRVDCYKRGHFILEAKKLKVSPHKSQSCKQPYQPKLTPPQSCPSPVRGLLSYFISTTPVWRESSA